MKKYLIWMAIGGAYFAAVMVVLFVFVLRSGGLTGPAEAGAFDAQGKPQVLLFTGKDCDALCTRASQELEARDAVFQTLDIDHDEAGRERFDRLGGEALPYLVAGGAKLNRPDYAQIASALAQLYGEQALTPQERVYYRNHFAADGSPQIYIYGASWCKDCRRLAERLKARGVAFTEIDVEEAPDMETMMQTLRITYYPTTYVGYDRVPDSESVPDILQAQQTTARRKPDTSAAPRRRS